MILRMKPTAVVPGQAMARARLSGLDAAAPTDYTPEPAPAMTFPEQVLVG